MHHLIALGVITFLSVVYGVGVTAAGLHPPVWVSIAVGIGFGFAAGLLADKLKP